MNEPFAERRERALAIATSAGAAALLASDSATVRWLTGKEQDVELVLAPWTLGTHVLVTSKATAVILPAEDVSGGASDWRDYPYEAFTTAPDLQPQVRFQEAVRQAVSDAGLGSGDSIAIEGAAVPAPALAALKGRPKVDLWHAIRQLRAVKDESELDLIRKVVNLVNIGQRTFRESLEPGIREIEAWTHVHSAMEAEAGRRVPALCDLLFGERCLLSGGPPTNAILRKGELGMLDLVPRFNGYWGDSCVTICAGKPSAAMRRLHDACSRALEVGIKLARPGTTARALDAAVREAMNERGYEYWHHTGHGVGLSFHEEPRIVPQGETVLGEGMVVALEPGSYIEGVGLRLEHLIVVRPDGGEVLTTYSLALT